MQIFRALFFPSRKSIFRRRYHPWISLNLKTNWPVFGRNNIIQLHREALQHIQSLPRDVVSNKPIQLPVLIGEFGIPYDLNNGIGFKTGDFSSHEEALSSYYAIFDLLGFSSTQWNYSVENSNVYGDNWNLENLSIFSREQQLDSNNIHSGGRAIRGFSRPYAPFVCGVRISTKFDAKTKHFMLKYLPFRENSNLGNPLTCTIVYLPNMQYQENEVKFTIKVRNGTYVMQKLATHHYIYVWSISEAVIDPISITISKP